MFFPSSFWIAAVVGLGAIATFAYFLSIKPTRESDHFGFHHPKITLPNLEYRTHPSFSFFAATYMRRNLIMVPEWRADFDISENEPMIYHEFAHLKRGDTFAFIWLYPFIAAFSLCLMLMATGALNEVPQLYLLQLVELLSDEPDDPLEEFRLLFFLALIVLPAFPLIQMLLLMRDREYGADRYAHKLLGERYADFISKIADAESSEASGISIKNQWRITANAILHPTFKQRDRALQQSFSYTELLGFWSGLHFSAVLAFSIVICVIFAIELTMRSSERLGIDFFDFASGQPAAVILMIATAGPLLIAIAAHGSLIVRNTIAEVGSNRAFTRLISHLFATTGFYILVALLLNYAFDGNVRAEEGWLFDFRRTAIVTGIFFLLMWLFWSCFRKPEHESRTSFLAHGLLASASAVLAAALTMVAVPSMH